MMFSVLAVVSAIFTAYHLIPSGISKFNVEKSAGMFASLGGDKVRYYVGFAEVAGPVLLLYPTTAIVGFGLIASVMIGAIYLHVKVWGNSPKNAVVVLLSALVAAAFWMF